MDFYKAGQTAALEKLAGAARLKRMGQALQRMFGHLHPAQVSAAIRSQNSGAGWGGAASMADAAHLLSLNAAPGSTPVTSGLSRTQTLLSPNMTPREVARAQGLAAQRSDIPGTLGKVLFNPHQTGVLKGTPYLSPMFRRYDPRAKTDLTRPRFALDPMSPESPDVQRGRFLQQHPLRRFSVPDATNPAGITVPSPGRVPRSMADDRAFGSSGGVWHSTPDWDPAKPDWHTTKQLERAREFELTGVRPLPAAKKPRRLPGK